MRFLLDTNILSDLVRNPSGRIADAIRLAGDAGITTSIIVAAELRYGAAKRGSERLTNQLETILGAMEILPFEEPADAFYGRLRAELERRGQLIGPNGLLIAAQCLAHGLTLVTDNEREFARVDGLGLENWLRPGVP